MPGFPCISRLLHISCWRTGSRYWNCKPLLRYLRIKRLGQSDFDLKVQHVPLLDNRHTRPTKKPPWLFFQSALVTQTYSYFMLWHSRSAVLRPGCGGLYFWLFPCVPMLICNYKSRGFREIHTRFKCIGVSILLVAPQVSQSSGNPSLTCCGKLLHAISSQNSHDIGNRQLSFSREALYFIKNLKLCDAPKDRHVLVATVRRQLN